MIDLLAFYKEYGQALGPRIGLTPGQFIFVEEIGDPSEVTEWLTAGNSIDEPILIMEQFQETLDNGGRDNYHTDLSGTLAVIRKGDKKLRHLIQWQARSKLLEAVKMMITDAGYSEENEEGALLVNGIHPGLRQIPMMPIGPISGNYYGYMLEFSWKVPVQLI